MNFGTLAKRLGKLAVENSPVLLTAAGVTGALATAYLTGTASFKAAEILREEQNERSNSSFDGTLEFKEKAELVWKEYIPAAVTATITVAAIISANRIGERRAAALASAYSISQQALTEYKKKVAQTLGEKKAQRITDDIAKDHIDANPSSQSHIFVTDRGEHRCFDLYTKRYFTGDIHKIKTAEIDLNFKILNEGYAALSDFWDLLGLDHSGGSDDLGWNTDRKFELEYTYLPDDRDRPCLAIGFKTLPIPKFYRFN